MTMAAPISTASSAAKGRRKTPEMSASPPTNSRAPMSHAAGSARWNVDGEEQRDGTVVVTTEELQEAVEQKNDSRSQPKEKC